MIFSFTNDFLWLENHIAYDVENLTTDSAWRDNIYVSNDDESWMVILPRSIFSIRNNCDNRIRVTSEERMILGIHVVYEMETTMINEFGSDIAIVEDVRSYPSKPPSRRRRRKKEKKKVTSSDEEFKEKRRRENILRAVEFLS